MKGETGRKRIRCVETFTEKERFYPLPWYSSDGLFRYSLSKEMKPTAWRWIQTLPARQSIPPPAKVGKWSRALALALISAFRKVCFAKAIQRVQALLRAPHTRRPEHTIYMRPACCIPSTALLWFNIGSKPIVALAPSSSLIGHPLVT